MALRTLHIDLAAAVTGLTRVVEKFGGDHVATNPNGNAGCVYAVYDNGVLTPVCIVGQFLANEGVLRAALTEDPYGDGNTGTCAPGTDLWKNLENYGVTVDGDAATFLREVQARQDSGDTWGYALAEGKRQTAENERRRLRVQQENEQAMLDSRLYDLGLAD